MPTEDPNNPLVFPEGTSEDFGPADDPNNPFVYPRAAVFRGFTRITVSAVEPADPNENDLWVDIS